jgi:HEAT repeat protein
MNSRRPASLARIFRILLPNLARRRAVAQVFNLLYRRLEVGSPSESNPSPAGWKTAIQQIGNLRYTWGPRLVHEVSGLLACCLMVALPLRAADLSQLMAEAAQYESGRNIEPLQKIEQLVRESAAKPGQRAELEAALVKLLVPSATFEARRFACQQLMVIGTDASLPALAELLKTDETVGIACLALSSRRSPEALEILRNALPAARGSARLQLISALGNHRDPQSAGVLAELARDADAAVAGAAMVALGKMGSESSGETMAALGKEARPATAWAVTEAYLRTAERLAAADDRKAASAIYAELLRPSQPIHIRRGALAALLRLDEDGGEQRILDVLRGSDAALKPVAIAAIGPLSSGGTSEKFAAALPKLQLYEQVLMVEALASRSDAAARSAVRAEVTSSSAEVRRAAIMAVGKREDASAVPLLSKALANAKSPEELHDIELALASLQGKSATDQAIVAELKSSSVDVKIRLCSVLALRGAQVAVPALLAEAGGSDTATVQAAFRALGRMAGAADLPALLEALANLKAAGVRADAESATARTLARVAEGSQRSEAVRAELTKRFDIESRCSLLRLLPNAADAKSLAVLKAASGDQEPRIREAAVRALAAWPDATAWDTLLAIYRQPENDAHRMLVLRALVRLAHDLNAKPDAALIENYRRLLAGARGDDDLKLILSALAGAAHPDALQIAKSLLPNSGVRAEAELAVKKIAEAIKTQQ